MYKVYDCVGHITTPGYLLEKYGIPFELEPDKWQFVDNIKDAHLILCINEKFSIDPAKELSNPNQIIVVLDLWHMDNNTGERDWIENKIEFLGLSGKKVVWVHENYLNNNPKYAYYDMMFNRSKSYFVDYNKISKPELKLWTMGTNPQVYMLNPIVTKPKPKKFLAPMRIYGEGFRMKRRRALKETLDPFSSMGYMNDTEKNVFFEVTGGNIGDIKQNVEKKDGGTWYPIANRFYEDSYTSIFIETVTEDKKAILASEKTFDPLIKGHYILPFGVTGYVKWLREYYGFLFPGWIDYSYDSELNDDARFHLYLASVIKHVSTDYTAMNNWANQDSWMLEHNRKVFYNRPYDSLYETVNKSIKHNGY